MEQGEELKRVQQPLYRIGDRLVELVTESGFDAVAVDGNDPYRPQEGVEDPLLMTGFVPDFSSRYGALAAGHGRLGWSGNLLTPEHGATIILGTVLTSATLEPDPLMEDNPCGRCKLCTAVCHIGMMNPREPARGEIVEIDTLCGVKVAVMKDEYEQSGFAHRSPGEPAGHTFLDTAVLKHLATGSSPQDGREQATAQASQ
ncbi:hypothetical protein ACFLUT_01575 [Chloroflexota bacterium]